MTLDTFRTLSGLYLVGFLLALGISTYAWITTYDPETPEWYIALSVAWPVMLPIFVGMRILKALL